MYARVSAIAKLALLAASMLSVSPAAASSLHVNPILLELSERADIVPLELMNQAADEVLIHIKSFSWRSEHGQEVLNEAAELVVTPSIFRLKPQERRTVRVGLMGADTEAVPKEISYRLFIDEMPVIARPDALQLRMRISLPVFLAPSTLQGANLEPEVERLAPGLLSLNLKNTGDQRLRLFQITTLDAQNRATVKRVNDYILADSWILRQIVIPPLPAGKVSIVYQDPRQRQLQSIEVRIPDEPSKMAAGQ